MARRWYGAKWGRIPALQKDSNPSEPACPEWILKWYKAMDRSLFLQRERVENTSRPGEMQVTIQNLMPATVYIFRVMAQNKHGSGESSAPLRVETQPEGKSPISLSAPPIGRPVWRATLYIAWHTIGVQKITVPHLQGPYKIVTGDQINSHQAVANSVRQYNSADRHPNFTDPLRLAQMPS